MWWLLAALLLGHGVALQTAQPDQWGPRRGLLLTTSNQTATQNAEQCLQSSFGALRCSPQANDGSNQTQATLRDDLVNILRTCLSVVKTPEEAQPVRILFVQSVMASLIANAVSIYSQTTGIPIRMEAYGPQVVNQVRLVSLANAANHNLTHESWVISLSTIGTAMKAGWFKDLSDLVGLDRRLRWEGLMPGIRGAALVYKSRVVAMPMSAFTYHLAYRKDVFAKHNLTMPRTWKQLAEFAVKHNGTDGMHSFCGLWGPCYQLGSVLIRYILAAYVQTHGPTQGWLFEPESMQLLLGSSAMTEVLNIIQALYSVSPVDDSLRFGCPAHGARFTGGECLMSVIHPFTYKWTSHHSNAAGKSSVLFGNLGFAPWPGSEQVLDVPSNTLVPCDDARCPYASRVVGADGGTALINVSPGLEAAVMAVNAHQSDFRTFFAFSLLSYIASPEASDAMIFNPESEMFPSRASQLDPGKWLAAGFEPHNSHGYCSDTTASLNHPNVNIMVRMPGAANLSSLLFEAAQMLHKTADVQGVTDLLRARAITILHQTYGGNITLTKQEYWYSHNREWISAPATAAAQPGAIPADTARRAGLSTTHLIVVLVLSIAAAIAVAGLAVRFYFHSSGLGRFKGQTRHPGPGQLTTLLVTDIENSTNLWECLEAAVMDASVKLHNACIRRLAAKHHGYESIWEGDSFTIAFHTPRAALDFALAAQKELLQLTWPAALLANEYAGEVWVAPDKTFTKTATGVSILRGASVTAASPRVSNMNGPQELAIPTSELSVNKFPSLTGLLAKNSLLHDTMDSAKSADMHKHIQAPGSSGRPSLNGAAALDMCQQLKSEWAPCAAGASKAVCVFRGLRVRMGLHAGVANESGIQYNNHMRRWHYTGLARTTSSAIASAGHGGYVVLSTSTMNLLGMDAAGALADLPPDCAVYHLGYHQLDGVDQPVSLSMVLPSSLKSRIAMQQTPLRTIHCVVPSFLCAPLPSTEGRNPPGLTVVAIEINGLSTLLSWDSTKTLQALAAVQSCIQVAIPAIHGYLSEDGISLVMATGKAKLPKGATFPDMTTPGRIVVVFRESAYALEFAILLRHQMLRLDWDPELLQHELCEQIGQVGLEFDARGGSLHDLTNLQQGFPTKLPTSNQFTALPDPHLCSIQPCPEPEQSGAGSGLYGSSSEDETDDVRSKASELHWRSHDTQSVASSSISKARPGAAGIMSPRSASRMMPPIPGVSQKQSAAKMCILEPALLRGLRAKTAVVQGPLEARIAARSSGMVAYTGKAMSKAVRWMKKAKSGQIAAAAHIVTASLQSKFTLSSYARDVGP